MRNVVEIEDVSVPGGIELDKLIERLTRIRNRTDKEIVATMSGSYGFGYKIQCSWSRPMTEEEVAKEKQQVDDAKRCERDKRRKLYDELRKEFEEVETN